MRVRAELSGVTGVPREAESMILLPGSVPGIPAYTVKVHAKYPDNPERGMPAIQGVIQLFDASCGKLLAVIDSPLLTAHRTAAVGAVAADVLARKSAESVAIVGAGVQGEMQFQYLTHVRNIHKVYVYDIRTEAAMGFYKRRIQEGFDCMVAASVREAVRGADIVILATWSREPFLFSHMVRPGTHITTLGPDAPGKVEVAEDLVRQSIFVCDDRELTVQMGALNTFQDLQFPYATLTEVLRGESQGRCNETDITIFGGVGLPFQDLVAAWEVYHTALELGVGQALE
jgi:ornithine cyclodeaminase/alanine dehydrogenase-like protein (mu-crystallin family)